MRLVIITGGVATGKTTASRIFKKHHIATIEFEDVMKAALQPNSPAFVEVSRHFGSSVLKPDGTLDMKRLGDITDTDPTKKKVYDDITRPYLAKSAIIRILIRWLFGASIIAIDSNVFFEDIIPCWMFNDIVTVNCSTVNQLQRLTENMGFTDEIARNKIKGQIPMPFKCAMSTVVLDNDGKVEELEEQIIEVIENWKKEKTPFYKYPDMTVLVLFFLTLLVLLYMII